jgi:hypothetical protein
MENVFHVYGKYTYMNPSFVNSPVSTCLVTSQPSLTMVGGREEKGRKKKSETSKKIQNLISASK